MILIRLDANGTIGSGHMMRCLAIQRELCSIGETVEFAVADEISCKWLAEFGVHAHIVGGSSTRFQEQDIPPLVALAEELKAHCVLIDSYAVCPSYVTALHEQLVSHGIKLAYIDDTYTFDQGLQQQLVPWDVDILINYGFAFSQANYQTIYEKAPILLIGPAFAPVRPEFLRSRPEKALDDKLKVLVTTGSTNPNHILERIVEGCLHSGVKLDIQLVIGAKSKYTGPLSEHVHPHHDVADMSALMSQCDIAVSAAGTTLYELATVGLPTIAVPIVENQLPNANGFKHLGLGLICTNLEWDSDDIADLIQVLAADNSRRTQIASTMRWTVDGHGARYIAQALASSKTAEEHIGE